jgi:hypothetical protein
MASGLVGQTIERVGHRHHKMAASKDDITQVEKFVDNRPDEVALVVVDHRRGLRDLAGLPQLAACATDAGTSAGKDSCLVSRRAA